ncbi:MAG TPA: hypothetical protein PK819_03490 [Thermomicrobiales bacterium]|nr:hypothetical protein [Thermomicrobiales bacterium]
MSERVRIGEEEFDVELPDPAEGRLRGVDLDLGVDTRIAGGKNLADHDEENMYGNDVPVDLDLEDEGVSLADEQ